MELLTNKNQLTSNYAVVYPIEHKLHLKQDYSRMSYSKCPYCLVVVRLDRAMLAQLYTRVKKRRVL